MAAELAIALVGVAGTLTVTALQHRATRTERTERTEQDRRRELVQAVTALVTALAAHRRAAAGSGKTRIAAAFPRSWRLSLDDCRERVADDFSVKFSVLGRGTGTAR
jgi:hypothetical protein